MALQKSEKEGTRIQRQCPFSVMTRAGEIPRSWTNQGNTHFCSESQCLTDSEQVWPFTQCSQNHLSLRRALSFPKGFRQLGAVSL